MKSELVAWLLVVIGGQCIVERSRGGLTIPDEQKCHCSASLQRQAKLQTVVADRLWIEALPKGKGLRPCVSVTLCPAWDVHQGGLHPKRRTTATLEKGISCIN
ncbi:hypothetical protein AF72_00885 [Xylella taiwanensis]|uniref:Uncharacterized protein n=1 Tax=Xylella taiwanensis TaxID=1444770 RepID=Z9JNY4_9GAMM|nr:hypothetical protein AB672_11215 [Xylella taiwanensis]EWS79462.1 hypothetical protein AF72_00885 [Xylella taiwanensis]